MEMSQRHAGLPLESEAMESYEIPDTCFARKAFLLIFYVVGFFLFIGSFFNEIRQSITRLNYRPFMKDVIQASCTPTEALNSRIVYISCPLNDTLNFYPPSAFASNLPYYRGIFLDVDVEMFQHVSRIGLLGPVSMREFVNYPVALATSKCDDNPSEFDLKEENPNFFPYVAGRGRHIASSLRAGGFSLTKQQILSFKKRHVLSLIDDGWYRQSEEPVPFHVDYGNTQVYDNALYTGNPKEPKVGDIKVTFWGSEATQASIIGVQVSCSRGTFIEGYNSSFFRQPITLLPIIQEGNVTLSELIEQRLAKSDGSKPMNWSLKVAGLVGLIGLLNLALFPGMASTQTCSPWVQLVISSLLALGVTLLLDGLLWLPWLFYPSLLMLAASAVLCAVMFYILRNLALEATTDPQELYSTSRLTQRFSSVPNLAAKYRPMR